MDGRHIAGQIGGVLKPQSPEVEEAWQYKSKPACGTKCRYIAILLLASGRGWSF